MTGSDGEVGEPAKAFENIESASGVTVDSVTILMGEELAKTDASAAAWKLVKVPSCNWSLASEV